MKTIEKAAGQGVTRPVAPKDQRTKFAYILGAICPERGVGAGLILPHCNTEAMQWHLDEISSQVTVGVHGALMVFRNAKMGTWVLINARWY